MPKIKLYGTERCHKTQHYKAYFETHCLNYLFLDVEENKDDAEALRVFIITENLIFQQLQSMQRN